MTVKHRDKVTLCYVTLPHHIRTPFQFVQDVSVPDNSEVCQNPTQRSIKTTFIRPSLHRRWNRGRWRHRWCHHIVRLGRCHGYCLNYV